MNIKLSAVVAFKCMIIIQLFDNYSESLLFFLVNDYIKAGIMIVIHSL